MGNKLYRCSYVLTYYAYADSPKEARSYAQDAFYDTANVQALTDAEEATETDIESMEDGWNPECLAYSKQEITIQEAFDAMKAGK